MDTSDARQLAASAARVAAALERRPTCSRRTCGARITARGRRALCRPTTRRTRARGTSLADALAALDDAPVAMRTLRSGVRIIYNAGDDVPRRVAAAAPATGASAPAGRARARRARWARDHRLDAEAAGRLCRDAGPAGSRSS